jgi:SIT4-associating protein SAP185/190
MHQKNTVSATAQSAEIEVSDGDEDELKLTREPDSILRNPFGDDAEEDVDDDSDDGLGDEGGHAGAWNSQSRGSWWRSALSRSRKEKFGDGQDDSDSEKDDEGEGDDEDEEFGDFAMPEGDNGGNEKGNVIVKPLPVHPPAQNQKSSAFTSLWPFSGQGSGSKEKDKDKAKEGEAEAEKAEADEITGDDGEKIKSTHEAKARTSIEDADDEEVVV